MAPSKSVKMSLKGSKMLRIISSIWHLGPTPFWKNTKDKTLKTRWYQQSGTWISSPVLPFIRLIPSQWPRMVEKRGCVKLSCHSTQGVRHAQHYWNFDDGRYVRTLQLYRSLNFIVIMSCHSSTPSKNWGLLTCQPCYVQKIHHYEYPFKAICKISEAP